MKILKIIRMLSLLVMLGTTVYLFYQHIGLEGSIVAASSALIFFTIIFEVERKENK